MFWKHIDPDGPESQHGGDFVRARLLIALEFATLGAYELLPRSEHSEVDQEEPEPPQPPRQRDPGSEEGSNLEPLPRSSVPAERPPRTDQPEPLADGAVPPAVTSVAHVQQARRHTSIRLGSRCGSEQHLPCSVRRGGGLGADRRPRPSRFARDAGGGHRSRRPGAPSMPEQPCTWSAWLADRSA